MAVLVVDRWQVSEGRVPTLGVVEGFDPFEDRHHRSVAERHGEFGTVSADFDAGSVEVSHEGRAQVRESPAGSDRALTD